jgi:hypothetical protein
VTGIEKLMLSLCAGLGLVVGIRTHDSLVLSVIVALGLMLIVVPISGLLNSFSPDMERNHTGEKILSVLLIILILRAGFGPITTGGGGANCTEVGRFGEQRCY